MYKISKSGYHTDKYEVIVILDMKIFKNSSKENNECFILENKVEKFFNELITYASNENATDIHIKPFEESVVIKLRVDGELKNYLKISKEMHKVLVSYIKLKSNMDISEKRIPQDGRMSFGFKNREIDIRISSIPSLIGESLVLRILNREKFLVSKENLGFRDEDLNLIKKLTKNKSGIILISGQTGSGKTTTAYSLIKDLIDEKLNIITIEDPVECKIEEITQIQVNKKINLDFEYGLKSILRHDPDVIFIGEIRDTETAKIAIKSANTGHLVISTIHTNDSISSIIRLFGMDIKPYLINSSLLGVISQKLVKTDEGRKLSYEILEVNDDLKEFITENINYKTLKNKAKEYDLIKSNKESFDKAVSFS